MNTESQSIFNLVLHWHGFCYQLIHHLNLLATRTTEKPCCRSNIEFNDATLGIIYSLNYCTDCCISTGFVKHRKKTKRSWITMCIINIHMVRKWTNKDKQVKSQQWFGTILTLSATAAALIMKSFTDTLICSEKTEKKQSVSPIQPLIRINTSHFCLLTWLRQSDHGWKVNKRWSLLPK